MLHRNDKRQTIIGATTPKDIFIENPEFEAQTIIEQDESQEAKGYITEQKRIEEAIKSRGWLSAAGIDGLD